MKKIIFLLSLVYVLTTSAQTKSTYMGYLTPICDTCKIMKDTIKVTNDFNFYNILSYGNVIETNFALGINLNKLVLGVNLGLLSKTINKTTDLQIVPTITLGRLISNDLIIGTELTYWEQSNIKFGYGLNLTYKIVETIGINYGQNTLTGSRIGLMITDIF